MFQLSGSTTSRKQDRHRASYSAHTPGGLWKASHPGRAQPSLPRWVESPLALRAEGCGGAAAAEGVGVCVGDVATATAVLLCRTHPL